MRKTHILLAVIVAAGLLGTVATLSPAQAQGTEPTALKNVVLEIRPEYDDPRLLVMMEGEIAGPASGARIRFLVPSGAEMYSAGSKDAQGNYSGGPPDRKASDIPGWDEIGYNMTSGRFRMEYYDASIPAQPEKLIPFEFRPLYPVQGLSLWVQEPRQSSSFVVSLSGGTTGVDAEGFSVHRYAYGDLDAGTPLSFNIAYTRTETRPSIQVKAGSTSNAPLIVGLVIVVVVIGGGVLYLINRSDSRSRPKGKRRNATGKPVPAPRNRAEPRFCSQCGKRLEGPARFCPACGADVQ